MGALDMALVATRCSATFAPRRYLAEIRDPTSEDGTEARARFWIVRTIDSPRMG